MKMYISGRISGLDTAAAQAAFARAEADVEAMGYQPVNPFNNGVDRDAPWKEHMIADIKMMLSCDGVYLLDDWIFSRGARIESSLAQALGIRIFHQSEYRDIARTAP